MSSQRPRAKNFVSKGYRFGPYPGKDNEEEKAVHWMSTVPYAKNTSKANLTVQWDSGRMFYKAVRDIQPREEFQLLQEGSDEESAIPKPTKAKVRSKKSVSSVDDSEESSDDNWSDGRSSDGWSPKRRQRSMEPKKADTSLSHQSDSSSSPPPEEVIKPVKKGKKEYVQLLSCEFCELKFVLKPSLESHMKKCHLDNSKKKHSSSKDKEKTVRKEKEDAKGDSKKTVVKPTKEQTHVCKDCGKVFKWEMTLLDHTALHTGKFECKYCKKRFGKQIFLDNHVKTCRSKKSNKIEESPKSPDESSVPESKDSSPPSSRESSVERQQTKPRRPGPKSKRSPISSKSSKIGSETSTEPTISRPSRRLGLPKPSKSEQSLNLTPKRSPRKRYRESPEPPEVAESDPVSTPNSSPNSSRDSSIEPPTPKRSRRIELSKSQVSRNVTPRRTSRKCYKEKSPEVAESESDPMPSPKSSRDSSLEHSTETVVEPVSVERPMCKDPVVDRPKRALVAYNYRVLNDGRFEESGIFTPESSKRKAAPVSGRAPVNETIVYGKWRLIPCFVRLEKFSAPREDEKNEWDDDMHTCTECGQRFELEKHWLQHMKHHELDLGNDSSEY